MEQNINNRDCNVLLACLPLKEKGYEIGPDIKLKTFDLPFEGVDLGALGLHFKKFTILEPYIEKCVSEICVEDLCKYNRNALQRAWLASSLIAIRGFTGHLSLAASPYSWNLISGRAKKTKVIFNKPKMGRWEDQERTKEFLIEGWWGEILDFHMNIITNSSMYRRPFQRDDAEWIKENIETYEKLRDENKTFQFATSILFRWRFMQDIRAAIASLWSGIEAICNVERELTFRIALYCSVALCTRGSKRKKKYNEIKKLYAMRSRTVHGSNMKEEELQSTLDSSYELLRDLVKTFLERKRVLKKTDYENLLLE